MALAAQSRAHIPPPIHRIEVGKLLGFLGLTRGQREADDLSTIVGRADQLLYVREFAAGLEECKQTWEFFSFCQGAHAGDRFFQHGTFTATETDTATSPACGDDDVISSRDSHRAQGKRGSVRNRPMRST
ncbi:hypothetical protein AB0878_05945 [Amycolatopsis sp. NPDC047767]|uniref:hypothetical protein n=1 Tax=Amycolatopsis sp. NPDC047767 TaxID=3156765 RepID=UPI0034514E37